MTTSDFSTPGDFVLAPLLEQSRRKQVYDLAAELFVAEGGNKPPHKCINDAMLFLEEWRAFCGMDRFEEETA